MVKSAFLLLNACQYIACGLFSPVQHWHNVQSINQCVIRGFSRCFKYLNILFDTSVLQKAAFYNPELNVVLVLSHL